MTPNTQIITKEQLLRTLPKRVHKNLTDDMLDNLNNLTMDQSFREVYRENILSFTSVINDGRYKIQSYLDAVRYVSHKLLNDTDIVAYTKTFPHRYQRLVEENADQKTIASYSTAYKKTKLVQGVFEQSMMPTHILNADLFQKAINVQANLMLTAKSEKVKTDAANSLLNHLKPPETKKIELDLTTAQDQSLNDLREATKELVDATKKELEAGNISAIEVARSKIIKEDIEDAEFTEE